MQISVPAGSRRRRLCRIDCCVDLDGEEESPDATLEGRHPGGIGRWHQIWWRANPAGARTEGFVREEISSTPAVYGGLTAFHLKCFHPAHDFEHFYVHLGNGGSQVRQHERAVLQKIDCNCAILRNHAGE